MGTFEQDNPDIPMTARDVLTEEELMDYVRKYGGKPWDRASGTAPEDEPPFT